jgi:hypothetical protein
MRLQSLYCTAAEALSIGFQELRQSIGDLNNGVSSRCWKISSPRGGELLYSSDRLAEQARLHAFGIPATKLYRGGS